MKSKEERRKRLEVVLREEFGLDDKTKIELIERGDHGTHISEVTFFTPCPEKGYPFGSGFSYLVTLLDGVESSAFIFAVERFLLDYSEEWDDLSEDYEGFSEEGLRETIRAIK